MRSLVRPLLIVALVLALPVVPFVLLGERFELQLLDWFKQQITPWSEALAGIILLTVDVALPVPSSLVSTILGSDLGAVLGTVVSWTGMTLGAITAFALARWLGEPLAKRFISQDDYLRLCQLSDRLGLWILAVTRPLPILAEATVLLLGAARFSWHQFIPVIVLSNLGISAVYAALGHLAVSKGWLPLALLVSVALPFMATFVARRLLHAERL